MPERSKLICADLHVHTKYSFDSAIQPKTIVDQLLVNPTVKAAAITDHNKVDGYYKVRELASTYKDVVIIPGVEVSTVEGDLIILGFAELPPEPWTVEGVIEFAHERGGLVIAAHPYREYGLGDSAAKYDLDAIEVLNGAAAPYANRLAEALAREMSLPGVAGSDAHRADELWTAYTKIQASSDLHEILGALKKGLVNVVSAGRSIRF